MLAVGIILILLSGGALVSVLVNGTGATDYFGYQAPVLVTFLAGVATLLVFIMGLELLRSGLRKANDNRKKNKRLRKLEQREESRHDTVVGAGATTGSGTTGSGTTGSGTTGSGTTGSGTTGSGTTGSDDGSSAGSTHDSAGGHGGDTRNSSSA